MSSLLNESDLHPETTALMNSPEIVGTQSRVSVAASHLNGICWYMVILASEYPPLPLHCASYGKVIQGSRLSLCWKVRTVLSNMAAISPMELFKLKLIQMKEN